MREGREKELVKGGVGGGVGVLGVFDVEVVVFKEEMDKEFCEGWWGVGWGGRGEGSKG